MSCATERANSHARVEVNELQNRVWFGSLACRGKADKEKLLGELKQLKVEELGHKWSVKKGNRARKRRCLLL